MKAVSPASIDKLRNKHKQLAERIKQLEARAKQKQRKNETRRKVLLGALLSAWMDHDAALRKKVQDALPDFLVRQVDRDVFGLTPLAASAPNTAKADTTH